MLSLLTVSGAIILGIVGSSNCHFLKYSNDADVPHNGLEPPFVGSFEANVGIFSYEIVRHVNDTSITDGCTKYDSKLGSSEYEAVITAQFCAIFAPVIGFMGLFVSALDTCFCRFCCSFLISSAIYLVACGVQAGVFSLYAEPDFW